MVMVKVMVWSAGCQGGTAVSIQLLVPDSCGAALAAEDKSQIVS